MGNVQGKYKGELRPGENVWDTSRGMFDGNVGKVQGS